MCLQNVGPQKVATEDIVCYKVVKVKNGFLTPYMEQEVVIGETYTSEIHHTGGSEEYSVLFRETGCSSRVRIDKALHSFADLADTADEIFWWEGVDIDSYKVVECIIPKGSIYYEGTFGTGGTSVARCYASNCIKYIKLLK
jgi:hypothetical protein